MLTDPTYDIRLIRDNPEWELAFVLSEILNDAAPLGWYRFTSTARCLRAHFDIQPKETS